MTAPYTYGGPVSDALEDDLRGALRRHGVVVWLDLDGHYSAFVDRLVTARKDAALPYAVHAFRGSHLALMRALDGAAAGVEKTALLIHLPGFNEDTVRQTPLLELYLAGVRYRKGLDTLVAEAAAGRVAPERIAAFKALGNLTLEGADAWLADLIVQQSGAGGAAGLGEFIAQLAAMKPTAVLDDLLSADGYIAGRVAVPAEEDALWSRFGAWFGLTTTWRTAVLPAARPRPQDIAFAGASWALAVEYVDDLKRAPVSPLLSSARELPRPVIDLCRAVATHLRGHDREFYRRTADETEAVLADEVSAAQAEDLGKIDTFRFEEDKVLAAALTALGEGRWDVVAEWAERRVGDRSRSGSFWLAEDAHRQSAWLLLHDAARLGKAIARAGAHIDRTGRDAKPPSLEAAIAAYVERGAAVDHAHRSLEQRRVMLLDPQVPEFETLRARLDAMRLTWRAWADGWARDFNAACRAHGFIPPPALQQRTLFDEVVRPLTHEPGPTAYFVVDALRYEMADELYRQLDGTAATNVHLKARLAELPSVTEVGMNVLAPVHKGGRLAPAITTEGAIQGFSTGEFRVCDPESRKRAMHDRVGGATAPWLTLEDVVSRDSSSLKRAIAQAKLVVVHSREIDDAGEKGMGPAVFDLAMQKLKAGWRLLRDAGVRRFVITSDHGFLLVDDGAATAQAHGRRIDPKRRHVFSTLAADHSGEVRIALSELGYDGVSGYLMFPETTAVFDSARRASSFVHGGNSLQERVIPVLTVVHRAAPGGSTLRYALSAEARKDVAGMHCIEAKVEVIAQGALDFGSINELEVALRTPEVEGVQIELRQPRGKARLEAGVVIATVGERFDILFRLTGATDARVQVELFHPSALAEVTSCTPAERFSVTPSAAVTGAVSAPNRTWLDELDEGTRKVFEHLADHGAITEAEAAVMLGGARGVRRFALKFEELAKRAPFDVRIDVVAGVKRYVREGREGRG